MSTRQMARMYSGDSSGLDGFGGVIKAIFGNNDVTGGPQIGPDGKIIMNNYQGHSGFLNREGRSKASDLNQQMMMQAYLQQMRAQGEVEAVKERNKGELDVEGLRGKNAQSLEQLIYSLKEALADGDYKRATAIADNMHKNNVAATRDKNNSDLMSKNNLIDSDKNRTVFNEATADPTIKNILGKEMMQANWLQRPEAQMSYNRGQDAAALAPVFANMNKGAFNAGPNTDVYVPDEQGNSFKQIEGPRVEQTPYMSAPGTVLPGMSFGQKYGAASGVTPGGPVEPVNPIILELLRKKKEQEALNNSGGAQAPTPSIFNGINPGFNLNSNLGY